MTRGGFEVSGSPAKRYDVYFQIRLNKDTPLHLANNQELFKLWGSIFTPDEPARFTQCRHSFTYDEISAATNLPKGLNSTLFVVCDVYDPDAQKYVASGWDMAAPLFVTTDADGKITKAATAYARPHQPNMNDGTATIAAKQCELAAQHLKLKDGAALYRYVDIYGNPHTLVVKNPHQADLTNSNRGYFFGPIDTANKARELIAIEHPNEIIIKTPEQYAAIVKSLKAVPGVGIPPSS